MTFTLRKFKSRDIPDLFAWFGSERDVLEWAGAALSWPLQPRELKHLIQQHRGAHPTREVWAVMRHGEMAGHFQLTLNRRLRTAGIGRIALSPDQRGRNRAAPLMQVILEQVFSQAWVHRADLLVYRHNHAAIRAYQSAGFVLEGTRRQTTPLENEMWDTHMMSLLRPEFDKRTERE